MSPVGVSLRRAFGNVFGKPRTIQSDFWSLHDAFVNAELMRGLMNKAPVDGGPQASPVDFFHSYRGRFERIYIGLLWVVVEAWERRRDIRDFCAARTDVSPVTMVLREGRSNGGLVAMKAVRDYSFHRDKREYWDEGRVGAVGYMALHESLYQAFSRLFLAVMKAMRDERKAEG